MFYVRTCVKEDTMSEMKLGHPSARVHTMIVAVLAGMKVVREGQRRPIGKVKVKRGDGNNTVVTEWDKASERVMLAELNGTGINVLSEESGLARNAKGEQSLLFLVDPLDGSKPFSIGASTSTVSIGLYDTARATVVAVVVGEPATGRICYAEEGQGAFMIMVRIIGKRLGAPDYREAERLQVWQGPLGALGVTLVDCYHNFRLRGHPVTPNATWGRLWSELNEQGIVYGLGTNCGHIMLVALGRGAVRGSITTCRGGPYDIAAGLLVKEAGGIVRCFSDKTGVLIEVGSLEVVAANFMVTAVDKSEADMLVALFKKALGAS